MNAGEMINNELDRIRRDVGKLFDWRNSDLDRANVRHAELTARLDALEKPEPVAEPKLANEAMCEGRLYRWDGKPPREPKKGEVFACCDDERECSPIDLMLKYLETTFGPRRIFVPVEQPADPPLPEGVRREMRPVLYVPTQGGEEAEIRGIMKCEHCYCLNGTVGGVSVTWGLDGERAIAMEPQNDLTVSLPSDEWKRLLGVANKPEDTER